jgi:branched-chain amino acid transport system substrate-binding protein
MPTVDGNKISGDTIPIGVVASLSGSLLPWGQDELKGAQLAVAEVNAAGGINGKKIDLKYEDSQSKAEQGKSAAEKLISEGVVGLVGEVASGITAQIAQAAFEKGIPVVAVGATKTTLTDIGANVFRVCYTDDFQGPVMATFAYKELGLRNIAVITDKKQPYSTFLSDKFSEYFKKLGGNIVDQEFYQTDDTQFKGILTNIKAKTPDGLFMSGYFPEVGPLARQAVEVGIKVPMLGGDGWDSKDILNGGGQAIVGSYFCNHYNNLEDRPVVKDFLAKWQKAYGGLPGTTMGALGYDAMMVTCEALKNDKSNDSKGLILALNDVENYHGVSGDITLKGNNGNPPKRALVVQLSPGVGGNGQKFVKAYEHSDIQ